MALKSTMSIDVPIVGTMRLPVIIKVCNAIVTKDTTNATVQLYCDNGTMAVIRTESHWMPTDLASADNPIRQAYLHLKSLSEFSGAVDC